MGWSIFWIACKWTVIAVIYASLLAIPIAAITIKIAKEPIATMAGIGLCAVGALVGVAIMLHIIFA